MATRGTIAIENSDGTVHQVYCHWDNYLSHNGKILFEDYSDRSKLEELIALGDISVLAPAIGERHSFSNATKGWTVAYGRDRGETGTEPKVFDDFEDYEQNHQFEEFEYIFTKDDVWSVFYNDDWRDLELELRREGSIETEEEEAA